VPFGPVVLELRQQRGFPRLEIIQAPFPSYSQSDRHRQKFISLTEHRLDKHIVTEFSKDKGLLQALSYITKIDACARLVLPVMPEPLVAEKYVH
jgi:hypothetical protein